MSAGAGLSLDCCVRTIVAPPYVAFWAVSEAKSLHGVEAFLLPQPFASKD